MENKIFPVFTPEDFVGEIDEGFRLTEGSREWVADIANAKLEKLLGPVVYSMSDSDGEFGQLYVTKARFDSASEKARRACKYIARLFDVQELKPKECEHEPRIPKVPAGMGMVPMHTEATTCAKCGAKLRAKWEVEDER